MSQEAHGVVEVVVSAAKVSPPIVAGTLIFFGIPLSQWALIFTLVYTIMLMGGWIYDRFLKKKKDTCKICGHEH